MFNKYFSLLILVPLALLAMRADAVQPLSSDQLSQLCANYESQPQITESMECARYIKGFIDGAIAADADIAKSQQQADRPLSSFKERAIQNRIGARVPHLTLGDESNGQFCLGHPVTIADVIKTVATNIDASRYQDQSALTAMQEVLQQKYPCSTS